MPQVGALRTLWSAQETFTALPKRAAAAHPFARLTHQGGQDRTCEANRRSLHQHGAVLEKSAALVAGGREALLTNCARRASRSAPYLGCLEQTLVPTNPPAAEKLALAGTPEDGSGPSRPDTRNATARHRARTGDYRHHRHHRHSDRARW